MFKKLVANLPFNPSLISQVAFYTQRLQRERAIRGVSFMFISMAMLVQMFAVIVPPANSLQSSSNHIIDGLKTRDDILRAWDDPSTDVSKIYGLFGATRDDIQNLPSNPNTTIFSQDGNNYWTIGRNSLFSYDNVEQQYKDSQITIQYEGEKSDTKTDDKFIYNRDLRAWDIINETGNSYQAFKGTLASTGGTFWILVDCGNFTKIDPYQPPEEPDPGLIIRKKIINKPDSLAPGDTYTYEIEYRNNKKDSTATDVVIEDQLDLEHFEVIKPTDLNIGTGGKLRHKVGDLPFSHDFKSLKITVQLKKNITSNTKVCNEASITASNADQANTKEKVCINVVVPDPGLVIRKSIVDKPDSLAPGDSYTYSLDYRNNKKDSTAKDVVIEDQLDLTNFEVTSPTDLNISKSGLLKHKVGNLKYSEDFKSLKITVKLKNSISSDTKVCNEATIKGSNADTGSTKEKVCVDVKVPVQPNVKIRKTILNKPKFIKPGDTFTYLIQYRNTVNASLAKDVVITDQLDTSKFEVIKIQPSSVTITNGFMEHKVGNLRFTPDYKNIKITVKVKDQIATGDKICNASRITATGIGADQSSVCITVLNPCTDDNNSNNPNCTQAKVVCDVTAAEINLTLRKVTLRTTASSTNANRTKITGYKYDFGDGTTTTQKSSSYTDEATHIYGAGNEFTAKVVVTYESQGVSGEQSDDCSTPIEFEDTKELGLSKSVKNITKDKTDEAAISTVLSANDVLEYTLTTTNSQSFARVGIEVSDDIGDILDYATLDEAYLKEKGGAYDPSTKKVVWRDVEIAANGEVLHTFRVKVKDPIPSTNQPSNMTTTFDCKLSNEYGDTVTINVGCPLVKGIEKLPNTGPGSSLLLTICITTIVGYFFARSRLFAREMVLIKNDYVATGGM